MLSSLSCRCDEQLRSDSDRFASKYSNNKLEIYINNEVQLAQTVLTGRNRRYVHLLFVFILLAGYYIRSSESRYLPTRIKLVGGDNQDLMDELNDNSYPCVCGGLFYKTCPSASCKGNNVRYIPHDETHPDHVDDLLSKRDDDIDDSGKKSGQNFLPGGDRVIRHRKVYVSEKPATEEPVILPMSITIPVEFKEDPSVVIPPPKPIFKMRKYITYETRPVIETVPVTTTIIRPVGVTDDQIINN